MMVLTPGLLVRALFLFALMNPLVVLETPLFTLAITLVVSVAWGLEFLSRQELFLLVIFLLWSCSCQKEWSPKAVDLKKYFCAQNPKFSS